MAEETRSRSKVSMEAPEINVSVPDADAAWRRRAGDLVGKYRAMAPGHTALVRRDSDWGGPSWWWGECSCGWIGITYSDATSVDGSTTLGTSLDSLREVLSHVGVDASEGVRSALDVRDLIVGNLERAIAEYRSAETAETAVDSLKRVQRIVEDARGALADAEVLARVQRGEL